MSDYYQLLGVGSTATPSIVKIAYEGKLKALERASLSEAEKAAERRELERAYATLSNPAKKTWYDNKLDQDAAAQDSSAARNKWMAIAIVGLLAVSGISWAFVDRAREKERLRQDEQRIALEQQKAQREAELERSRLELERQRVDIEQQRTDLVRDVVEKDRADRNQAYSDHQRRQESIDRQRNDAQERADAARAARDQQFKESRDRAQAEADRRRALAEVERQKKFVQQREAEDERARKDRYYRAQLEESQRRAREAAEKRQSRH